MLFIKPLLKLLTLASIVPLALSWEYEFWEESAGASADRPCTGGGTTVSGSGHSCQNFPGDGYGVSVISNPEGCSFTPHNSLGCVDTSPVTVAGNCISQDFFPSRSVEVNC
ncbi:hypothetical protein C8R43DRAFT_372972 [Mycena crocata]|nr:hypothetical protein C8R43DRAFT_372972 [Mycena crocata]